MAEDGRTKYGPERRQREALLRCRPAARRELMLVAVAPPDGQSTMLAAVLSIPLTADPAGHEVLSRRTHPRPRCRTRRSAVITALAAARATVEAAEEAVAVAGALPGDPVVTSAAVATRVPPAAAIAMAATDDFDAHRSRPHNHLHGSQRT